MAKRKRKKKTAGGIDTFAYLRRLEKKINDREAADRAVRFISRLKHTKGKWAGMYWQWIPWERMLTRIIFGTKRPDGRRQYRIVFVEMPKKNAKTEWGAAIGLYCLTADGEASAECYSAAADIEQASIVYNCGEYMVRNNPSLSRICKILSATKRIVIEKTSSFWKVLSSDHHTKEGSSPHVVIIDELHAHKTRALFDVLAFGATDAREQPLTLITTTAGEDRESVCYEQHDYALKVMKGIIDDPTFLPVLFFAEEQKKEADGSISGDDWEDEEVWKATNPSMGYTVELERIREEYRRVKEIPALIPQFKRRRLNMWVRAESRFLPMHLWDACAGDLAESDRYASLIGRKCVGGLDLSATTDLTAFVLVFLPEEDSEIFDVLCFFWVPLDQVSKRVKTDKVPYDVWIEQGYITGIPGAVIDHDYIFKTIDECAQTFDIMEIGFDRWGSTEIIKKLEQAEMEVVAIGQGFQSMSPPTKDLLRLVSQRRIRHGANPVLRWNADNAVAVTDPAENIKLAKDRSTERIDGIIALIMAISRALVPEDEDQESVYEESGVKVLG